MKKLILIALLFQVGCTHLTTMSISPIPVERKQIVKAESKRFMFLLFNFDTDYVNQMTLSLAQQCPNGDVKGILTKHESITYFPLIAHESKVTAEGYCVGRTSK